MPKTWTTHAFVPCQDILSCPSTYHTLCHHPVGPDECNLSEGHVIHDTTRSITEVADALDADLEEDRFSLLLDADRDPEADYSAADLAVSAFANELTATRTHLEILGDLASKLAQVLTDLTASEE